MGMEAVPVFKLKHFGLRAIKESFDQLSTAACFFDRSGRTILCNRQMYRLSQHLLHGDVQDYREIERALLSPPANVVQLADTEHLYRFPDKTVWNFEKTTVTDRYGASYLQLTAADVTALYRALVQLADDNKKLEQDAEELRKLSQNVEAVAREKEQFAAKAAMHDSFAACITATKQYLAGDLSGIGTGAVLHQWEKSMAFRNAVLQSAKEKLLDSAKNSGVTVRIRGGEPSDSASGLIYDAMQVCLNNAIQYAQATELAVNLWESAGRYTVMIRNNGKPPEKPITEGGGLSNLRRRIERAGGSMTVQSLPVFSLVIDIPKSEDSGR